MMTFAKAFVVLAATVHFLVQVKSIFLMSMTHVRKLDIDCWGNVCLIVLQNQFAMPQL
jgi:hypothetical protein